MLCSLVSDKREHAPTACYRRSYPFPRQGGHCSATSRSPGPVNPVHFQFPVQSASSQALRPAARQMPRPSDPGQAESGALYYFLVLVHTVPKVEGNGEEKTVVQKGAPASLWSGIPPPRFSSFFLVFFSSVSRPSFASCGPSPCRCCCASSFLSASKLEPALSIFTHLSSPPPHTAHSTWM